jgi:signal transduction histidine kinase
MKRRFWPAALAAVSILLFASYLVYTQLLVEAIKTRNAVDIQIYGLVQRGLYRVDDGGANLALFDIQETLLRSGIPMVFVNSAGEPSVIANTPFKPDSADGALTAKGRERVLAWTRRTARQNPAQRIAYDTLGAIYFGDPAVVGRMRWVPAIQVGAALLLLLFAFVIMRADMRASREQLYSAMARELAHQMGTPLSSLSGWVEVLQLTADERELMATPEKIGRLMQSDVERLERVSRRFELIGKPQALEIVAIPDVVNELYSYFKPRLPHLARGITLRTRMQHNLPPVRANRVLLVWALENIVKNAIDALAGRGGHITILALSRPDQKSHHPAVHIIIADTGPGIDPAVRDRIFEAGVTTKSSGWGVGLALSRRIIKELHDGSITVENRAHHGTAFDIELPAAQS